MWAIEWTACVPAVNRLFVLLLHCALFRTHTLRALPVMKNKMKDFKRFRKMLKENSSDKTENVSPCCPSCHHPFDKGKKRRLIDTCGHERCYTCIFTTDHCSLCRAQGQTKALTTRRSNPFLSSKSAPKQTRPNTVSIENQHELAELAKRHNSSYSMRKISSLWTIGEGVRAAPNEFVSRVDLHHSMDQEMMDVLSPAAAICHQPSIYQRQMMGPRRPYMSRTTPKSDSGNSTDASPVSTLSLSSEKERTARYNSLRSREQSVTSLMSVSSSSSTVPMDIIVHVDPRSRADAKRFSFARCSNFSLDLSPESAAVGRLENLPKVHPLTLKPLYFEVPQPEMDVTFIGRQWVFREIEKLVTSDNSDCRGLVIVGDVGTGKTSLILQMVDYSSFGRKWEDTVYQTTQDIYWRIRDLASRCSDGDQMSMSSGGSAPTESNQSPAAVQSLAARVVGYHFCQSDCNYTCLVPDFVHGLAAQLCQAPQLIQYRDLLMKEPRYQHLLSLDSCLSDPDTAFVKGILEPLELLSKLSQVSTSPCIIVIDSIHEAEQHRSTHAGSIASFLSKHIHKFPHWLKVVLTVRASHQETLANLPMGRISLDRHSTDPNIQKDILSYIRHRINDSSIIQANITSNRKDEEECAFTRFSDHLASTSKGCFLYAKLTLDLLQRGHLVIKSSSYSVLPVSLREVFMLMFNIRFTTNTAFSRVTQVLEVCLASFYPLNAVEIYHTVNACYRNHPMTWPEFLQQLEVLTTSYILVPRQDGSLMIAHPYLREWLTKRNDNESSRFLCDIRAGHAAICIRMCRMESPLSPEQSIEFAHHILKADIYRRQKGFDENGIKPDGLQAVWLQMFAANPSAVFSHPRNIFAPNLKVSRMLLEAGADPNSVTTRREKIPLLVLAAQKGFHDIVSLLLEFGANCNSATTDGQMSPLAMACREGHLNIVRTLLTAGAKINCQDRDGRSIMSHSATGGQTEVVKFLIQCKWPKDGGVTRSQALQEALVASGGRGYSEICEILISEPDVSINTRDSVSGHTPLTCACQEGQIEICKLLLRKKAPVTTTSESGMPAIIYAIRGGHWEVVEILLAHQVTLSQTDKDGKTPLIWAASEEKLGILELLLEKGALVNAKDKEGMSALSWACLRNHVRAAQCLLDNKADLENKDRSGRTPLSLASENGSTDMVNLLLKQGANMEAVDLTGMRPLEHALKGNNLTVVSRFLHHGVKLGPRTWTEAKENPKMVLLLLHKLLSDGIVLYKKDKLSEAAHRFQYALKKFPNEESQADKKEKFYQLRYHLHLGLSRCKRKMKEYDEAVKEVDDALRLRPSAFEALYIRARANHESGRQQEALSDVNEAIRLSNSDPEVSRTLQKLKEDILTSFKVISPLDGEEVNNSSSLADNRPPEAAAGVSSRAFPPQPCRTSAEKRIHECGAISRADERPVISFNMPTNGLSPAVH